VLLGAFYHLLETSRNPEDEGRISAKRKEFTNRLTNRNVKNLQLLLVEILPHALRRKP
jgi:hypothetical protein